jgi:hypothetical protein
MKVSRLIRFLPEATGLILNSQDILIIPNINLIVNLKCNQKVKALQNQVKKYSNLYLMKGNHKK